MRWAQPRVSLTLHGKTIEERAASGTLVCDGRLVRYSPEGKIDRSIEVPVKKVTSVIFGSRNLDILYVTSMAKPALPRFPVDGALRGSLFAIYDRGIRGVLE